MVFMADHRMTERAEPPPRLPLWERLLRLFQFAAGRKFPLLNGLAVTLGFFLLPGLILYRGVNASFQAFKDSQMLKARRHLENRLDQLEFFAANDQFAHYLLTGLCKDKNGRGRNIAAVRNDLARLKKKFPGVFTFAVADRNGYLIPDASDVGGYTYLYRQAFSLVQDADTAAARRLDGSAIPEVEVRLKRLRPLLGNLLQTEDLTLPLRGRRNGRSVSASGSAGRFHLWYGIGGDFKLICFISRSFIRGRQGLEWATEVLNRLDPDTVTGFAPYPPAESSLVPNLVGRDAADVIQALARREGPWFESSGEWNRTRVACRFLRHDWRGFCFFKTSNDAYFDDIGFFVLGLIARFSTIAGFIFLVHNLRHPVSLTVKLRILAFFAYAVCLPLLVIASLTMQYIEQSEKEMMNELKSDAQRAIEKIDAGYIWFQKELARRTAKYLSRTVERDPGLLHDRAALIRFYDGLKAEVNHSEIMIVDTSGEDYLLGIGRSISKNRVLMSRLGRDALQVAIAAKYASLSQELPLLVMHLADDFYYRQNSIGYLGVGDFEISAFYRLLRPRGSDLSASMFAGVFWRLREMHHDYIKQHCRQMFRETESMEFAVLDTEDDSLLEAPQTSGSELIRFMKLSINRFSTNSERLRIAGRDRIAVAMPAKNLDSLILAAFIPAEIVSRHTDSLVTRARYMAMFLLLMAGTTFLLLHNWIFMPLAELKAGLEAIGNRDFHKRLEVMGKNELGRLTAAFNHSLETLQDLAVAGAVQESLLPEPHLVMNRVEVVARTCAMTNLGGDYYDMIKLDDQRLLLFIGDATGHGIPAALSMAMAKAITLHESGRGLSGQALMLQFNQVFNKLRSQGSRDFMTALCVEVNTLTGAASLINAGHPFPMLLKAQSETSVVLDKIRGMPPGFDIRREFTPSELRLEPGDCLFLFTDGFVESVDRKGGQTGFDGLARLVAITKKSLPAEHLNQIFTEFNRVAEKGQDDCTMVVIKYS